MVPAVVILGGGIGGMSAAHELIERGFKVDIYERTALPGGKARSVGRPGTGLPADLPGEHGFRFFPRFYRHVTDTMKRIPLRTGGCVADNLVKATEHAIALSDGAPFVFPLRFPWRPSDWRVYLDFARRFDKLGLKRSDLEWFGWRVWQLLTMCDQRTAEEYERVCWWEFLNADNLGPVFQDFLAAGLTRTLVAAQPRTASTQVGGRVLAELIYALCTPGSAADQLLSGPTNETWLDPWQAYLESRGVTFHFNSPTTGFRCVENRIAGVMVHEDGQDVEITADYYVAALPVEVMGKKVNAEMVRADETLLGIRELATHVGWMTGAQFHLDREVPVAHGHVTYIDSPWALTSISQKQFWTVDLATYGPGTVKDVLSVDISNWVTQEKDGRPQSRKCKTEQEVLDEVWSQVKTRLGIDSDVTLLHSRLDPEITFKNGVPGNGAPLFVNHANSWRLRPDAYTRIPNLFLASDYVRTHTSLASMEAANEAARRAVNAILAACPQGPFCKVWPLGPPWHIRWLLRPLRHFDAWGYARGVPYRQRQPWYLRLLRWVVAKAITLVAKTTRKVARLKMLNR